MNVTVKTEIIRWARERSRRSMESLLEKFPHLLLWERGQAAPTLKQLENFAKATFTPIGYFFLNSPPTESLPIPDLRTMGGKAVSTPSPDLLDMIYLCQRRQAWYRDYAVSTAEDPCDFVGSANLKQSPEQAARRMRALLGLNLEARRACPTWVDALRRFIEQAEKAGVLVMVSGVVGVNNRRKLDPEEFRGFAISDNLAPLVFINGSDTKAAQMFTLAHELAHLWLGESALSNLSPASTSANQIERWCNAAAAELLVPLQTLRDALPQARPLDSVQALARRFKVSTLVILRRIFDAGHISQDEFQRAYQLELEYLLGIPKSSGGNFYLTQEARASRRFVKALVASTLEGQTLYRDAFQLLGIKKAQTFTEFGAHMGLPV